MPDLTKIATCCYCGARTVLRLRTGGRHELACASCAAPLHELKRMKIDRREVKRKTSGRPIAAYEPARKRRKPKRRDWDLWDVIWDGLEELFEEIYD